MLVEARRHDLDVGDSVAEACERARRSAILRVGGAVDLDRRRRRPTLPAARPSTSCRRIAGHAVRHREADADRQAAPRAAASSRVPKATSAALAHDGDEVGARLELGQDVRRTRPWCRRRAARAMIWKNSCRSTGSRPVVGSSSSSRRGAAEQRLREAEPLAHALRIGRRRASRGRRDEPDALEQLAHAAAGRPFRRA